MSVKGQRFRLCFTVTVFIARMTHGLGVDECRLIVGQIPRAHLVFLMNVDEVVVVKCFETL